MTTRLPLARADKTNSTAALLPGVIFAKALQPLAKGDGMIYVYVTLH